MGAFAGVLITLLGIYGGEAVIERWKLGPRAALSLGWLMGMVFMLVVVVVVLANATEAP